MTPTSAMGAAPATRSRAAVENGFGGSLPPELEDLPEAENLT